MVAVSLKLTCVVFFVSSAAFVLFSRACSVGALIAAMGASIEVSMPEGNSPKYRQASASGMSTPISRLFRSCTGPCAESGILTGPNTILPTR